MNVREAVSWNTVSLKTAKECMSTSVITPTTREQPKAPTPTGTMRLFPCILTGITNPSSTLRANTAIKVNSSSSEESPVLIEALESD
jgi:hypothetical protein